MLYCNISRNEHHLVSFSMDTRFIGWSSADWSLVAAASIKTPKCSNLFRHSIVVQRTGLRERLDLTHWSTRSLGMALTEDLYSWRTKVYRLLMQWKTNLVDFADRLLIIEDELISEITACGSRSFTVLFELVILSLKGSFVLGKAK